MKEFDRRLASRHWLVVMSLASCLGGFAITGCGRHEQASATATDMERVAQTMDWPGGAAPSGARLVRVNRRTGGGSDPSLNVGFANVCAWYLEWRRQYTEDRSVDPEVTAYIAEEVPYLPFVVGVGGARESFEEIAGRATEGDPSRIDHFLRTNQCRELR